MSRRKRIFGFSVFTDILKNRYAYCVQCDWNTGARTLRTLEKRCVEHRREKHP